MLVECSRKSPCSRSLCSLPGPFSCLCFPLFLFTPSLWSGNTAPVFPSSKTGQEVRSGFCTHSGLPLDSPVPGRLLGGSVRAHCLSAPLPATPSPEAWPATCPDCPAKGCVRVSSCLTCPSSWLWAVLTTPFENLAFLQPPLALP